MKNKLLSALLSFAIAFGLWYFVITVVSPESEATYYDVPVVFQNESVLKDKGLMLITGEQPKVTLRLKGNRSDLNKLKKSDITLTVDLSRINDPGQQSLSYTISYPGDFASNAFETLSRSPDRITVDVVAWSGEKDLEIKVNPVGSVPADYIIDPEGITQDKTQITIEGHKSVVDKIAYARVDVPVEGKTASISENYKVTLCDANGDPVDFDSTQVKVHGDGKVNVGVRILRVKVLPLKLDVLYGGGATLENVKIRYEYETIKVAGEDRLLEGMEFIPVEGTLDLSALKGDIFSETYTVKLKEGLINLDGITEVKITVTFQGVKTTELNIPISSNMAAINIPEGLTVADIAKFCKITFRGPEALIDQLTAADVVIRVDLTDATVGEGVYKAQVEILNSALKGSISVVGTYTISVTIAAEPATP